MEGGFPLLLNDLTIISTKCFKKVFQQNISTKLSRTSLRHSSNSLSYQSLNFYEKKNSSASIVTSKREKKRRRGRGKVFYRKI